MTAWVGLVTLIGGVALWITSRRERAQVPTWFPRLAVGITALGVSTMLLARGGTLFSVLSAAFSVVAIAVLASIIWSLLRRR